MLIVFEVLEKEGELVAVHDGAFGVLVAIGHDWDELRDEVGESIAFSLVNGAVDVEVELIVDENHRTRFKCHRERTVTDSIRPGT